MILSVLCSLTSLVLLITTTSIVMLFKVCRYDRSKGTSGKDVASTANENFMEGVYEVVDEDDALKPACRRGEEKLSSMANASYTLPRK